MKQKSLIALLGVAAVAVAAPVAAVAGTSAGPAVHVEIRSTSKTLRNVVVHGERGWITKGGTPRGKCSGDSAAGALSAATKGHWTGKYYASVGGIFIESVLGVKPPSSNDYWSVYVNGHSSNEGVCLIKLRKGEKLQFKIVK